MKNEKLLRKKVALMNLLKEEFAKNNIDVFPIKSFDEKFLDNDLDLVVVDSGKVYKARQLLESLGFSEYKNRARFREPYKFFYLPPNQATKEEGPIVHLHSYISWNGVKYIDSKKVFNSCVKPAFPNARFVIPNAENELLIDIAHTVFENLYLSQENFELFKELNKKIEWEKIKDSSLEFNWPHALDLYLLAIQKALEEKREYFIYPFISILRVSLFKLLMDLSQGKLWQVPRQVFSYFVVNTLMHLRAKRLFK